MDDDIEDSTFMNTIYTPAEATDFLEPVTLNLLIPLSIVYLIILIAGLLGNTSTCIVIAKNRAMHTATNFYLFSLAISDLLLLIFGLPIELHQMWNPDSYPLGEPLCILMGLLSESSANATVLTITAFTVERYIAICRPFMSHTTSKLSRAVRIIIAVWVFAVCTALPQVMHFGLMTYSDSGLNKTVCTIIEDGAQQAFVISSFLFFVVPMSIIIVLYALIGFKLRTSRILNPEKQPSLQSNGRTSNNIRYRNGTSQNKVIRMLVAVTLSFFLCWAPFHVQRLMAAYASGQELPSKAYFKAYLVLNHMAGVLYFLSTAINPILYNIMSNKFRNAFRLTLSTCCRKTPHWRRATPIRNGTLKSTVHRPRPLQRQLTGTTQLQDNTAAQRFNGTQLAGVHLQKMGLNGGGPLRRLRIDEGSESVGSPQSISNSSLKEFDEEMDQELATYIMYHVESHAKGPPDIRHTLIRRATYN